MQIGEKDKEEKHDENAAPGTDPSKVPAFAEPWFLTFNADVQFRVVMTPEDLKKAGLDEIGKKWR